MSNAKKAQRVSCFIELGGDSRNIVFKDAIMWTEIAILQSLHGEASIHTFKAVDTVERPTPYNEKLRLYSLYSQGVVDHVYPGNRPNFEWFMPTEGVDDEDEEDEAPKPKARRVPAGVIAES